MTIGERAAKAICKRAEKNGTTKLIECAFLGINPRTLEDWKTKYSPSAYYLQQMVLNGYDVIWILTGMEQSQKVEINLFDKEEIFPNCTVQVLTNTATGETSVGWWKNDNAYGERKDNGKA